MVVTANSEFHLGLDPSQVRAALDRVLSSPKFRKSQCHSEFLRFVVEKRLKPEPIREEEIGVSIYRRDRDYDPSEDAIVRVEASRLRARLKEYYEDAGVGQNLRFDIPKGTISPVIIIEGAAMQTQEQGIWMWTGILVAVLGMLILAGVVWRALS